MRLTPRSKYGAQRTTVDNIAFASVKEARRYQQLKLLEQAGEIVGLCLQPEYVLSVATDDPQAPKQIGVYRGDFEYAQAGQHVVEDVKGFKTPLYKWKKKHVEAQYGIVIKET